MDAIDKNRLLLPGTKKCVQRESAWRLQYQWWLPGHGGIRPDLSLCVVLPKGIPYKGQVLNQIATKFLDATADIVPNWKIATPDPMVTVGHNCEPFKVEMVIRGYLTGSSWPCLQSGERTLCGLPLPEGMKENKNSNLRWSPLPQKPMKDMMKIFPKKKSLPKDWLAGKIMNWWKSILMPFSNGVPKWLLKKAWS